MKLNTFRATNRPSSGA